MASSIMLTSFTYDIGIEQCDYHLQGELASGNNHNISGLSLEGGVAIILSMIDTISFYQDATNLLGVNTALRWSLIHRDGVEAPLHLLDT